MNATTARRLRVFDTSLRDGEQSPGCSMTAVQKLTFAHALADLGVDIIEAGFAASSSADADGIHKIASELTGIGVASLSRCHRNDIEAAARALAPAKHSVLHLFLSTSPIHREFKLQMSKEQVLQRAEESVTLAKNLFTEVEFSAEDAIRTEPDFLIEVFSVAAKAGARVLNVPDTVGYTTPDEIRELFKMLRAKVRHAENAIFSAHCHNDLGLAVANTLAAVEGGADQVECTINGIGERAGNCALEELIMALRVRSDRYPVSTGINTPRLVPTSRLLTQITGMVVQRNKAIVGANAFAHEAGIHQHGMMKHRETYEIMRPEDVGWERSQLVLGRHSGRAALADRIKFLGFHLEEDELNRLFGEFKTLAERKKEVLDADLEALIAGHGEEAEAAWRLKAFHISTGAGEGTKPAALVEVRDASGEIRRGRGTGDGPVHALFKALSEATGVYFEVESYHVRSVTSGEDAQGQAQLVARAGDEELNASGVSTDILEASANAWLELANRLERRRGIQDKHLIGGSLRSAAA